MAQETKPYFFHPIQRMGKKEDADRMKKYLEENASQNYFSPRFLSYPDGGEFQIAVESNHPDAEEGLVSMILAELLWAATMG